MDGLEEIERGCCERAFADGGDGGNAALWAFGVWRGVSEVVLAPEAVCDDGAAAFWAASGEVDALEVVAAGGAGDLGVVLGGICIIHGLMVH